MWECGLKHRVIQPFGVEPLSLLMWECGLKRYNTTVQKLFYGSLLMWECGLKPELGLSVRTRPRVTPYVGVWIETTVKGEYSAIGMSLLMWECGLKRG